VRLLAGLLAAAAPRVAQGRTRRGSLSPTCSLSGSNARRRRPARSGPPSGAELRANPEPPRPGAERPPAPRRSAARRSSPGVAAAPSPLPFNLLHCAPAGPLLRPLLAEPPALPLTERSVQSGRASPPAGGTCCGSAALGSPAGRGAAPFAAGLVCAAPRTRSAALPHSHSCSLSSAIAFGFVFIAQPGLIRAPTAPGGIDVVTAHGQQQ